MSSSYFFRAIFTKTKKRKIVVHFCENLSTTTSKILASQKFHHEDKAFLLGNAPPHIDMREKNEFKYQYYFSLALV